MAAAPGEGGGTDRSQIRTFLIADVRGYTSYTNQHGDEAAARLTDRFAQLAREVLHGHEGEVLETRGDEIMAVFSSARGALRGAVELQRVLKEEMERDPSLPLKVGIGIDTGEAVRVADGFRGGALNLATRLCGIAAPGEVFASEGAVHTARKMEGFTYLERGEVALKGMSDPVKVIHVLPKGADPGELPRFTVHVTAASNLPPQPTPFIGRAVEVAGIAGMLLRDDVRLLTMTGPGGTGKTRLALQAANEVMPNFPDGVYFVSLASLSDPGLVPSAIASALQVRESAGEPLVQTLQRALSRQHLLLVLDNMEHLLDACSVVGALLDAAAGLKVLVTSRTVLRLAAEHDYAVPPLAVPDPQQFPDLHTFLQYDAVALFIARAEAARRGFTVTRENAPAIAEICSRLDGLPLAIELAAARSKLFPPQAMLQRLVNRLTLLTGGARDRPTRQQTLRGAIDWSYELLDQGEKRLFARLSIFAGGCTLEAAEAVCNAQGDLELDVLDGIASLMDKSLLREEGEEEPRFLMLETIREYAGEKLRDCGEEQRVAARHAGRYLSVAEEARREIIGPNQLAWNRRLEAERDNLEVALHFTVESEHAEIAYRLGAALWLFWERGGRFSEGRQWLQRILELEGAVQPVWRAQVLEGAGALAARQSATEEGRTYGQESVALFREIGDPRDLVVALSDLAITETVSGSLEEASRLLVEGEAIARELDNPWLLSLILLNASIPALWSGDLKRALLLGEESLLLARRAGDYWWVALDESNLGEFYFLQGDTVRGRGLLQQSLATARELGSRGLISNDLEVLAWIASAEGQGERAVRLFGAAARLRERNGEQLHPGNQEGHDRYLPMSQAVMDEQNWQRAWEEGQRMTLDQAIDYALQVDAASD